MNLWMLKPVDAATATKTYAREEQQVEVKRWTWDCAYGFMVRAETEEEARSLASEQCGDEGPESWTDTSLSTCDVVSAADGEAEVLMQDFLAG